MTYFEAIIISIIQGLTEFLPISSTGHMIITESVLGLKSSEFVNLFAVSIHFGTILSVIILYWKRFFKTLTLYYKLFIAFLPAAVFGFFLDDFISSKLGNVTIVAVSLLAGGVVLLFVDKWFNNSDEKKDVSYSSALKIGLFQVIAMIPGVSRSAATIVGGMTQKLTRKTAAEFSFLLAVPTILAASGYKIYKTYEKINSENINILIVGNIVAFIVAIFAIRIFIGYLQKHGFRLFGYYRIVLGIVILLLLAFGVPLQIDID